MRVKLSNIVLDARQKLVCVYVSVVEAYHVSVLVINVFDKELNHMAINLQSVHASVIFMLPL